MIPLDVRGFGRLAVVFVPTLLIIGAAGVLTLPDRLEIDELEEAAREARSVVAEAARVRPLLAHHEKVGVHDLATISRWLSRCAPTCRDPGLLLADLRLMELECGVAIRGCEPLVGSPLDPEWAEESEDAEPSVRRTGSTWRIEVGGEHPGLIAFLDRLTSSERIYLIRAVRIERMESAGLQMNLVIFVPGLIPGRIDESEQGR
ncbi:MAG: hypothetical protein R3F20_19525 [Planctomycetota bacterium]